MEPADSFDPFDPAESADPAEPADSFTSEVPVAAGDVAAVAAGAVADEDVVSESLWQAVRDSVRAVPATASSKEEWRKVVMEGSPVWCGAAARCRRPVSDCLLGLFGWSVARARRVAAGRVGTCGGRPVPPARSASAIS
ncbi:hypothetical protein GCM10010345_76950 [Streptomyces canarius]|uniref:Uncharacterized protein n=1 Tax=Streptomyces canarius TaxID=285453 RepID=A0ABQ3DBX4_9ACTN|nr:hypothetical protein GCM10010345_76950 [Streptomyces canarius]